VRHKGREELWWTIRGGRRTKPAPRNGTKKEGRYKSSVVDSEECLLACSRYIELNPVRARMVMLAGDFEWSSFQQRVGAKPEWLDSSPCFRSLGSTVAEARSRYRELVEAGTTTAEYEMIRQAVQRNQLTGSGKFVDEIEATLGLRVERRGPGRPRKER
jgi:putative transposase